MLLIRNERYISFWLAGYLDEEKILEKGHGGLFALMNQGQTSWL